VSRRSVALAGLLHIKSSKEIMPKDPKKMMRDAFETFSTDGFMNATQLAECLSRKDGEQKVSQQEAQVIINEFDKDGDGKLSFEEFMDAMADM
jgi:Ca2+-binding EF-hand superfamily protein